jgi:NADH:ubiquinone oxidoreductase subunit 3 (subunit A)
VFLFPWAIVFAKLGTQAFVEMVVFIVILGLALLYAVRKKVLDWL